MRTIYKYKLNGGNNLVTADRAARWLHVAEQHGEIAIWAEVDPEAATAEHRILVAGTGHSLPAKSLRYIGTAVCDGGNYVFHTYEEIQ